jgi:hypothetical protein
MMGKIHARLDGRRVAPPSILDMTTVKSIRVHHITKGDAFLRRQ